MLHFPKFTQICNASDIDVFAGNYFRRSGFNVNRDYYETNQVFAIYCHGNMIGGFVLGTGETLRTLEVFASNEHRDNLYRQVQESKPHTEMCCFWMAPDIRKNTRLNFFIWLCVAYALWAYGTPQLIFGTNSVRLAALYSATPKCHLLRGDYLNHKQTFIFTGPRKDCLVGVAQILIFPEEWKKGKVLVFNYFSSPAGATRADHIKVERDIWKPIHAARVKDGKMKAWILYEMEFPFGASMPYNMATADVYTDMKEYLAPWFEGYFKKVHPGKDMNQLIQQTQAVTTLQKGEVRMILDRLDWK